MEMIIDDLEDAYYMDILVSEEELKKIKSLGMVECREICDGRRFYVGVRLDVSEGKK